MSTHRAKRIDTGEYEYRGYALTDTGGSNSVRSAMARYSGRWVVAKITGTGFFDREGDDREGTLRDAKKRVDRILAKSRT